MSRFCPEIVRLSPTTNGVYYALRKLCIGTVVYNGYQKPNSFHYRDATVDLRCRQFAPQ